MTGHTRRRRRVAKKPGGSGRMKISIRFSVSRRIGSGLRQYGDAPADCPWESAAAPAMLRRPQLANVVEAVPMAETVVPHFPNDPGVPGIEIGARELMGGAAPPPPG